MYSKIGFGTWGLGGDAYGEITESDAVSLIRHAYRNGIKCFDTADLYGVGEVERRLSLALSDFDRNSYTLITKGGLLPHKGFTMNYCYETDYLSSAIRGSLGRLNTDFVDTYLIHSPTIDLFIDNRLETWLNRIKLEGLSKSIGVSALSPSDALFYVKNYDIDVVEINFNLLDQRVIDLNLFDICLKRNVKVIARTPLCFGFLSGGYTGDEVFPSNDHRSNWPRSQLKLWAEAPTLFRELTESVGCSLVQLALAYVISFEAVTLAIPGFMNKKEIKDNLKSLDLYPLPENILCEIRNIYLSNNFYDKTSKK